MKVFFQIKFSITAKEETQIEEELSNYVLTWLESKYGVAAKRAISACKSLLSDSEFGDPKVAVELFTSFMVQFMRIKKTEN